MQYNALCCLALRCPCNDQETCQTRDIPRKNCMIVIKIFFDIKIKLISVYHSYTIGLKNQPVVYIQLVHQNLGKAN